MASRTVSVALIADVGQYQSAMVKAASVTKAVGTSATAAGTEAKRGFEAASRGATLLAGVAAGGLALGLKSAVSAASDAEQSIGGVEAVFKGYARGVIASSKEADRALGLSANSYRELSTIIGSQMKNAGVPLDQLAEKTEGIIGIGADLAAQFGGSTQEAVEALSSAFRGELDPIERYGISLTAAAVGAKAVEMGLSESETGLSQNAKAMATLAIVTEQSADAQGAFARESDTAAGRAQRAAAQWENLKVAVGDRLLPAWSALVDVLGTEVIPFMGDLLDTGGDVVNFMMDNKEVALALAGVLAVQLAGGITAVVGGLRLMAGTTVVPLLSSILAVVGNLPAAFAAARAAVAGFIAAAAPLVAVGAVVYAITKTVDFATAAGDARKEVAGMWGAVEDARGLEQLNALGGLVDGLKDKIQSLREELPETEGAFQGFLGPLGMLESGGAIKGLEVYEKALEDAEFQQRMVERTATSMGMRFGLTRDQVLDLASKYNIDLTSGLSNVNRLFQNFYSAEYGSKPTEAVINLAGATDEAKSAFDDAKQAVDGFKLSLDILTGAHVSMLQVESALQAALADSKGAMDDLGGAVLQTNGQLNLQSENGRVAGDVLLGIRDAGNQWISTMIQQGATTDQVAAKDAELRQSFINSAMQMGISEDAAKLLADQILGIPSERQTKIDADTKAANDKIAATQRGIDNLHGKDVTINVRAAGRFIVNPSGGLQEFAEGGWTGPGSKYTPAGVVHADEFVVPKHRVNALGGPSAVGSLVGMPGYANGGPVAPINVISDTRSVERTMEQVANAMKNATKAGTAGGGAVGGGWASLWNLVKANIPQARMNSTFRLGDPGYHGRGKAIDFGFGSGPGGAGSAGLASINRFLHDRVGSNLAELIYDGIGDDRPDLKNGRPLTYSASTRAEHRNHVHAAVYDQGGTLSPGYTLAYNGTGKNEYVSKEMPGSGGTAVVVKVAAPNLSGMKLTGTVAFDPSGMLHLIDAVVVDTLQATTSRGDYNP